MDIVCTVYTVLTVQYTAYSVHCTVYTHDNNKTLTLIVIIKNIIKYNKSYNARSSMPVDPQTP